MNESLFWSVKLLCCWWRCVPTSSPRPPLSHCTALTQLRIPTFFSSSLLLLSGIFPSPRTLTARLSLRAERWLRAGWFSQQPLEKLLYYGNSGEENGQSFMTVNSRIGLNELGYQRITAWTSGKAAFVDLQISSEYIKAFRIIITKERRDKTP